MYGKEEAHSGIKWQIDKNESTGIYMCHSSGVSGTTRILKMGRISKLLIEVSSGLWLGVCGGVDFDRSRMPGGINIFKIKSSTDRINPILASLQEF